MSGDQPERVATGSRRVLHVITGLRTGGAERMLCKVALGLNAHGWESHVLSLSGGNEIGDVLKGAGIEVTSWPRPASPVSAVQRTAAAYRGARPQVILGWMYHGNLVSTLTGMAAFRAPTIWNVRHSLDSLAHETPRTRRLLSLSRPLSRLPRFVLYNSETSRRQHEAFGFASRFGKVIPNGFDTTTFAPAADRGARVRAELGIPAGAPVFGIVARWHPVKNYDGYLDMARLVLERHPTARAVAVGRDVRERLAGPLLERVPEALRDRVILLPESSRVADLLQALDVFCLTSWSESFPNVLGEAMACGVPCVSTDVGDAAAIIGETGLVVPAGDMATMAEHVAGLLERRDEASARGTAARARIVEQFSLDAILSRYADLLTRAQTRR